MKYLNIQVIGHRNVGMKKQYAILFTLLLLVFSLPQSPTPAQESKSGIIHGQVIDYVTGLPVRPAFVHVFRPNSTQVIRRTIADSLGMYRIENVPVGYWTVGALGGLYPPSRIDSVRVEKDGETEIVFKLLTSDFTNCIIPKPFTFQGEFETIPPYYTYLTGFIRTQLTTGEIPGVRVELLRKCTEIIDTTISDESGQYTFKEVPPGYYLMKVHGEGYHSVVEDSVQVVLGGNTYQHFILLPIKPQ